MGKSRVQERMGGAAVSPGRRLQSGDQKTEGEDGVVRVGRWAWETEGVPTNTWGSCQGNRQGHLTCLRAWEAARGPEEGDEGQARG